MRSIYRDRWVFGYCEKRFELCLAGEFPLYGHSETSASSPSESPRGSAPRPKLLTPHDGAFALHTAVMFEGDDCRPLLESICRRLLLLTTSGDFDPYRTRELRDAVVRAIECGFVAVHDVTPLPLATSVPDAPPPPEPRSTAATSEPWIELRVVWDETDEPISGLSLVIEPRKSERHMLQTDSDGRIRVDPVMPGPCEVRCSFAGLKHDECVEFVGTGEASPPVARTGSGAPAAGQSGDAARPARSIIAVERRKVRTGDTLASIATAARITWEDLAYFNCGSRSPKDVNRFLALRVGCTKKTKDKQNYVFDDADDPGVLLVPVKWAVSNLETGSAHTLRVAAIGAQPSQFAYSG